MTRALRDVNAEAVRCVAVIRQATLVPAVPDDELDWLFRSVLRERRTWANQVRKAAKRRDTSGVLRADHHGTDATVLGDRLGRALAAHGVRDDLSR